MNLNPSVSGCLSLKSKQEQNIAKSHCIIAQTEVGGRIKTRSWGGAPHKIACRKKDGTEHVGRLAATCDQSQAQRGVERVRFSQIRRVPISFQSKIRIFIQVNLDDFRCILIRNVSGQHTLYLTPGCKGCSTKILIEICVLNLSFF